MNGAVLSMSYTPLSVFPSTILPTPPATRETFDNAAAAPDAVLKNHSPTLI